VTDLLTPGETAPKHEPEPSKGLVCEWCEWTTPAFPKGFATGRLQNHVKHKHPEHFTKREPQGQKKAAPKKPVAQRVASAVKSTTSSTPAPVRRRKQVNEPISDVVSVAGEIAQFAVDPVLGNCLVFEADAAGLAIDHAIEGTFLDRRFVQPAASAGDRFRPVASTLGLPIMLMMISRQPQLRGPLDRYLRAAVVDTITYSIPAMEARAKREQKAAEALDRFKSLDRRYGEAEDPVGLLIDDLLGPLPEVEEEAEGVAVVTSV
jgi:hypothetical protein